MLELLVKYAEKNGLATEPGFASKTVRWALAFDENGQFNDVIELGNAEERTNKGITFPKCPDMTDSEIKTGTETKCHFLVESAEVVACAGENEALLRIQKKHSFFIKTLESAGKAMPELLHVASALRDQTTLVSIRESLREKNVGLTDKVTLRTGSIFPVETGHWHDWWRNFRAPQSDSPTTNKDKGKNKRDLRCFASGERIDAAVKHPKVSGLRDIGKLTRGDVLIGFDKEAYQSYGLAKAENAPVVEEKAWAYTAALNHLLQEQSVSLAGPKVAYWYKDSIPPEDDPMSWLTEGDQTQELHAKQAAQTLLKSIKTGERADLAGNLFYALTLSGGGGRVMVRDWIEGQFEEFALSIVMWFDDLEIVNYVGSKTAKTPGIERIITSLLPPIKKRQKYSDWVKPVGADRMSLWNAAILTQPVSGSTLARVVNVNTRFRVSAVEEEVLHGKNLKKQEKANAISLIHARMGLIKAYHLRRERMKGGARMPSDLNPYLNEEHPNPAYHCGRLMAVLAGLQHAALGDVGAGVVQRYYGAASSTPALVFGRLTRTSQHHLSKLGKNTPRLSEWFSQSAEWYEGRIAGIWSRIRENIPPTLSLEEQSLFALGYYQEMANMRSKKAGKTDDESKEEGHD